MPRAARGKTTKQSSKLSTKRTHRSKSRSSLLNNKKIGRAALIIFLVIVSAVILFSYIGYKLVTQKFASAQSGSSYSLNDAEVPVFAYIRVKNFNTDPVFVKDATIYVLDKLNNKMVAFTLSGSTKLDIPGKFGEETFEKVFAFGGLDKDDKISAGIIAINRALFKVYGIDVKKYVLVDDSTQAIFDNFITSGNMTGLVYPKTLSQIGTHIFTNIALSEYYDVGNFITGLSEDRFITVTLPSVGDNLLRELFLDTAFSKQPDSIAVLNGSGVSGMAAFTARVVRNIGGRVVAINNSDVSFKQSIIVAQDPDNFTVLTLAKTFNVKKIIPKETARSLVVNSELDRSDVILILGSDQE